MLTNFCTHHTMDSSDDEMLLDPGVPYSSGASIADNNEQKLQQGSDKRVSRGRKRSRASAAPLQSHISNEALDVTIDSPSLPPTPISPISPVKALSGAAAVALTLPPGKRHRYCYASGSAYRLVSFIHSCDVARNGTFVID